MRFLAQFAEKILKQWIVVHDWILVSRYHFPLKEIKGLWEMAVSTPEAENDPDDPGTHGCARKRGSHQILMESVKSNQRSTWGSSMAKNETMWT